MYGCSASEICPIAASSLGFNVISTNKIRENYSKYQGVIRHYQVPNDLWKLWEEKCPVGIGEGRGPMRPLETAAVLGNLTGYAEKLWPDLAGIEWTHGWNGRIAITNDHLPHIHDLAPGLAVCLGYNGAVSR